VGGVRTFVQESGPPDGPAVVLVHGFGGSTFNWRYTLPALAEAFNVALIDLYGREARRGSACGPDSRWASNRRGAESQPAIVGQGPTGMRSGGLASAERLSTPL